MSDATGPDAPRSPIDDEIARMPMPTAAELRWRSSLPRQAVRFVVLNLKIFRLSRRHR